MLEFAHALLQITERRVGMGEDRFGRAPESATRSVFVVTVAPKLVGRGRRGRQSRRDLDFNGMFAEPLARI